jgi:ABC-type transport system involved in multi-copper enzyme maturation permease subunit
MILAVSPFVALPVAGLVFCLIQLLAAIPWVMAVFQINRRALGSLLPRALALLILGAILVGGALFFIKDKDLLGTFGRWYGLILEMQLILDFFVVAFAVLLLIGPRGAAVAVAAFREWLRHPLFWFVFVGAAFFLLVSPIIPYFTFGEDMKMVKELGYDWLMLGGVFFGVVAAAMSISEEIEGRTAITLMSKPISRRQFLLGKFAGILLAALLMTAVLSVLFGLVIWYKNLHPDDPNAVYTIPRSADAVASALAKWGDGPANLAAGATWYFIEVSELVPGLVLGFCQVMVLLAIAVALATRLPFILNVVVCVVLFFLSHLTPVLEQVSRNRFALVQFVAKLFNSLLPGLDYLKIGNAIVLPTPPDPRDFTIYVASVALYAVIYTTIALLFGLILFEDRDLA